MLGSDWIGAWGWLVRAGQVYRMMAYMASLGGDVGLEGRRVYRSCRHTRQREALEGFLEVVFVSGSSASLAR